MINLKRIGSTALVGLMLVSTFACTLSEPADKGGDNEIAQITSRDLDLGMPPEEELNTEPETETDEQFVLAQMDSKYHAYYDGKVYFREYKKSDYAEDIMLYFSDPFEGGIYNSTTPKKLCVLNADGSVDTVTENDPGQGIMYVIDGVLYSQYFMEDGAEANPNPTHVYKYDLNTKTMSDIKGYRNVLARVGDYLVMRADSTYDASGNYVAGELCIVNPKDLSVVGSMGSSYELIGVDYDAMYGVEVVSDYTSGDSKYTVNIARTTASGVSELLTSFEPSTFENWYYSYPEITCYQIVSGHLFVNIGYYQGTGHFYQEGFIYDIDLISKSVRKITDTGNETFYCTEGMDGMFVNIREYSMESEKTETVCIPVDGEGEMKAEDYVGQQFMVPYIHYDFSETEHMKSGDVSIFTDVSSKPTKLLGKSDYEGFGYTLGYEEGADYETADQTELYNVEYCGNKLFFSLAVMERTPDYDVGWRYTYKVKKMANFVKDLKTGEVTKLYEE